MFFSVSATTFLGRSCWTGVSCKAAVPGLGGSAGGSFRAGSGGGLAWATIVLGASLPKPGLDIAVQSCGA